MIVIGSMCPALPFPGRPPGLFFFSRYHPVVRIKEKDPSRGQPSRGLSPELNAMLHSPSSVIDRPYHEGGHATGCVQLAPSVWHCCAPASVHRLT
jgi:hypothetical protein